MKVAIIGSPFSGKSTLANSYGVSVFCSDPASTVREVIEGVTYMPEGLDWEEQSHYICENWFPKSEWVIEGVGVVRALRKWINYYDSVPPCYQAIYIRDFHPNALINVLPAHNSMAKSIETIWNEIAPIYSGITTNKFWGSSNINPQVTEARTTFRMFRLK